MKEIVIATNNAHKVQEVKNMLEPLGFHIATLKEKNCIAEVEENGTTFAENALLKAREIYQKLHTSVISDDSGLIIDELPDLLGVHSARFMGHDTDYKIKNQAILDKMKGIKNRKAKFVCAIAYINEEGKEFVYEGVMEGSIAEEMDGENGFGYDPIFYYPPFESTISKVDMHRKNLVSHRGKALAQLVSALKHETQIHIVLYEPEIPQNTGNIIRTCMATNVHLHLIEPLGFSLDEKQVRRCSMDYIKEASITIYKNWSEFLDKNSNGAFFFMTRHGKKAPSQFDFPSYHKDIYIVLGKESAGIPKEILQKYEKTCMRLPMVPNARSLNLSNCAAVIVYEVLRQFDYNSLSEVEVLKGEDWIQTKN